LKNQTANTQALGFTDSIEPKFPFILGYIDILIKSFQENPIEIRRFLESYFFTLLYFHSIS